MKRYFLLIPVSLIIVLFSACSEDLDVTLLHGTWQADQFIETGEVKEIDLSNMNFHFDKQFNYTYQSNLKYREAGKYRIDRSILYSTDTLSNQRIEKAVRIASITTDSLHLLMNNGGIEQEIFLHKVK